MSRDISYRGTGARTWSRGLSGTGAPLIGNQGLRRGTWVTEKEQGQDNQVGLLSCDDLASQTIAFEPRILWVLKSSINNGISICRIQVALL